MRSAEFPCVLYCNGSRVGMFRALLQGFRHYADFRGCSTRAEFFAFLTVTHLIVVLLLAPAIVELLLFWRFAVEDVRFYRILELYPSVQLHVGEICPVLSELGAEYATMNGGLCHVWWSLGLAVAFSLIILPPTIAMAVRWKNSRALPPMP